MNSTSQTSAGVRAAEDLAFAIFESGVGPLEVECSTAGLRRVSFAEGADAVTAAPAGGSTNAGEVLARALQELAAYFAGQLREFTVPLDARGTEFQQRAWKALCGIPYGATISYEEQARRLGMPGAQRAIGRANATNPIAVVVPCHRVIEKSGGLRGYGGGLERKKWLLDLERRVAGVVLFKE